MTATNRQTRIFSLIAELPLQSQASQTLLFRFSPRAIAKPHNWSQPAQTHAPQHRLQLDRDHHLQPPAPDRLRGW